MSQILLLVDHKENVRLLSAWLSTHYEVFAPGREPALDEPFDLCILDGPALDRLWHWAQARRAAEQPPIFLPFLLMTSRQDVQLLTRHLWQSVDELVTKPVEKLELQARVEILLRTRQLSLDLKAANAQLQESNRIKSHFLSIAAHELRNPLGVISVAAQLLERCSDKHQEKRQDFFQLIKKSVARMTSLLDGVLAIGKSESRQAQFSPASLDLVKFCADLVAEIQLSTGSTHELAFACQGECVRAGLDENLLYQILTNLLSNAIKYSPQGGPVQFELVCEDENVSFQIQDQGIGISVEDQQQVFESFYRAENVSHIPGTGLGLAIIKQCVDLHGGQIMITSEVGLGTAFKVILPLPGIPIAA